jgi:hypothetical protein
MADRGLVLLTTIFDLPEDDRILSDELHFCNRLFLNDAPPLPDRLFDEQA